MKQIIISLTEEQQAKVKLLLISIDAKAAKKLMPIIDATDSVELIASDLGENEANEITAALGLIAAAKLSNENNI